MEFAGSSGATNEIIALTNFGSSVGKFLTFQGYGFRRSEQFNAMSIFTIVTPSVSVPEQVLSTNE
jgi:hypothetical protein